ncbi:UNVERIFIED_CONTAM: signal transduction histidine kinase [Brevibacillus sp. OAP136]
MRLSRQLHIAFAVLLVAVIGITSILFYSFLLDKLVAEQRKEMREKGKLSLQIIAEEGDRLDKRELQAINNIALRGSKMEIILYRGNGNVLFSTLSEQTAVQWIEMAKDQKKQGKELFQGKDDKYIVEIINNRAQAKEKLILAMPLHGIKEMQLELAQQVLLILLVGGLLAYLLSLVVTRRLVKPLTLLRLEVNKVKERRFSEVKRIEANGEIGDVAHSVYQMADELERFGRMQKEFFQNASHELKTPLMAIQGYAEGIRDGVFVGERAEQGLDVIVSESIRLKEIVTEMILLAKLESEEDIFHLQPTSLNQIVTKTTARLGPLLMQKGLHIHSAIDGQTDYIITADPDKLLQAMLNIVGNCIRYAKANIFIECVRNGKEIILCIRDDGKGIDETILPQLFHRFVKGKDGETGLGMAISRVIIERCGGKITAENHLEGGAMFTVRFHERE